MAENFDISLLSNVMYKPSSSDIANRVIQLITSGDVPVGAKLPSIIPLSKALGVSIGTISEAWAVLRKNNMVRGIGRQGLVITNDFIDTSPLRFTEFNQFNMPIENDLSYSNVDPNLLPDLKLALEHSSTVNKLNYSKPQAITPELEHAVALNWPYIAESFLAVDGDYQAIIDLLDTFLIPNAVIAVEEPTTIAMQDIIKKYKLKVIAVPRDEDGPQLEALKLALSKKPLFFIYQPNHHFLIGNTISQKRLKEMVKLVQSTNTMIIEHDTLGDLSSKKKLTLGAFIPEQIIYIRTYLKAYGPDLCLAVLSAPEKTIRQLQKTRSLNLGRSSRLLQSALAWLIQSPETQKILRNAEKHYIRRRNLLINILGYAGINFSEKQKGRLCLSLLVPVVSESLAIATLSASGILVIAGSQFMINKDRPIPAIRVSTSTLERKQAEQTARVLKKVL